MKKMYLQLTTGIRLLALTAIVSFFSHTTGQAQGVTAASIFGQIVDAKGVAVPGAIVTARHEPSGTLYGIETREDGRFNLPNVRIGGPYTISVNQVGVKPQTAENIFLSLGQNFKFNAVLADETTELSQVLVTATKNEILNGNRTGAGTNIKKEVLTSLPSLGRSFSDFLRLAPGAKSSSVASTAGSGISFAGQDSRFNNLTLDGSIFNNSFGLASGPGGQANAQPVSLDAIDEVQVAIAPYDVRQGGFVGGGINAVTRSGTNNFEGSAFYNTRTQSLVGTKADTTTVNVQSFDVKQFGGRLGGPIIKDKLFFFINFEGERRSDPATTFMAYRQGLDPNASNVSRASADSLDQFKSFLVSKFNYNPGAYENYSLLTTSNKGLAKLDWNIFQSNNQSHRASLRFNFLNSSRDVGASGSNAVGSNGRFNTKNSQSFQATNYIINNDIYSGIAEINSVFGSKISNTLQFGFTANRDVRGSYGGIFPLIDILQSGSNVTSAGYEPFTPNNILNTDTYQAKDDVTFYQGAHTITAGVNIEAFKFDNGFTPLYYGQFVYNSFADFYKSANAYLNNTKDSTQLAQFQLTYSALPGHAIPLATTKVTQPGVYLQDEISLLKDRMRLTVGIRVDRPTFQQTALSNPEVTNFNFIDGVGNTVKTNTGQLPDAQTLFSPRIGFNYDVLGDRSLQIRGGVGVFSGRPPYVWLSNQVSNNGILTGAILAQNTKAYPFSPDPTAYIPANATTPASYNIAVTDPNFKFPQLFRANLAIDKNLFYGIVGTIEGLYSKNINQINYLNVNQVLPSGKYSDLGDNRPYFPKLITNSLNSDRVYAKITNAILLNNTDLGYSYSVTAKLERQFRSGWYAMLAYTRGEAKDVITGGSIAASSWNGNLTVKGNNLPDLAFSDFDQRDRFIGAITYALPWFAGVTKISAFLQSYNVGRTSYIVSGDINGDGNTSNDLMYIPARAEDVNFIDNKVGTVTFTKQDQINAFNQFLNNDPYLNSHRGSFAERNGVLLPFLTTIDLSASHDFVLKFGAKKHGLQARVDIFNFGNLINHAWGVSPLLQTTSPLLFQGFTKDASGNPFAPTYKLRTIGGQLLTNNATQGSSPNDVWQMQLGVRYTFQ